MWVDHDAHLARERVNAAFNCAPSTAIAKNTSGGCKMRRNIEKPVDARGDCIVNTAAKTECGHTEKVIVWHPKRTVRYYNVRSPPK